MPASPLDEFRDRGFTRLEAQVPRPDAAAMHDFLWEKLSELHGIERERRETWAVSAPWTGLNRFHEHSVFEPLGRLDAWNMIDALLAPASWTRPRHWGGFPVNLPTIAPEDWTVLAWQWHVDFHFTFPPDRPFGVLVFVLLSDVAPKGGGTAVVAGSHRAVARFVARLGDGVRREKFAALKRRFNQSDPWLARLTDPEDPDPETRVRDFMEAIHERDGVRMQVRELVGRMGDVFLVHPWLLHAPSLNAGAGPRFMRAKQIYAGR